MDVFGKAKPFVLRAVAYSVWGPGWGARFALSGAGALRLRADRSLCGGRGWRGRRRGVRASAGRSGGGGCSEVRAGAAVRGAE